MRRREKCLRPKIRPTISRRSSSEATYSLNTGCFPAILQGMPACLNSAVFISLKCLIEVPLMLSLGIKRKKGKASGIWRARGNEKAATKCVAALKMRNVNVSARCPLGKTGCSIKIDLPGRPLNRPSRKYHSIKNLWEGWFACYHPTDEIAVEFVHLFRFIYKRQCWWHQLTTHRLSIHIIVRIIDSLKLAFQ